MMKLRTTWLTVLRVICGIGLKEGPVGLSEFKLLSEVLGHKVGKFLCWPQYEDKVAEERVLQLEVLGVESVALGGPHAVLGNPILGKGHAGIVLRAIWQDKEVALKIRRTDADRQSMKQEAGYLEHVNKLKIGPRLFGFSDDFIVMELLMGSYFGEWVVENLDNREAVISNIRAILDIAWRLDQSGLDHGELTRIKRHYIVTDTGPRVIDFESASFNRKPSNLTSTVQSLYMNYRFSQLLGKTYPLPERDKLLNDLRKYKQRQSKKNYHKILETCNIYVKHE
jgi:putative serine/threonine protein kinase